MLAQWPAFAAHPLITGDLNAGAVLANVGIIHKFFLDSKVFFAGFYYQQKQLNALALLSSENTNGLLAQSQYPDGQSHLQVSVQWLLDRSKLPQPLGLKHQ